MRNPFRNCLRNAFHKPSDPDEEYQVTGVAWLINYIFLASFTEPRIAIAIFVSAALFTGWNLVGLFFLVASFHSTVAFLLALPFLEIIATGLSWPLFIMIAWGKMRMREWVVDRLGIVEHFVTPFKLYRLLPAYRWTEGRERIIVRQENGRPMPWHRKTTLYRDEQVYRVTDKRGTEQHFAPKRRSMVQRVNQGLLVLSLLGVLFMGVLVINPGTSKATPTPAAQSQSLGGK